MELLFIIAFAAAGMAGETKRTFGDWGRRKLDASRSTISAKRAEYRPGGRYRSARGNARVRYVPFRAGWALADVVWSFCSAVRAGARDGARRGRERYQSRLIGDGWFDEQGNPISDPLIGAPEEAARPTDSAPEPVLGSDEGGLPEQPRCWWCGVSTAQAVEYPSGNQIGHICPPCKTKEDTKNREQADELARRRTSKTTPITTGGTMSDAGSFEQVGAMLGTMREAAVFAVDDANNDLKRAQEDASNTEAMVSFAQSITAGPSYEQPLARTGDTSTAITAAKVAAVAAAETHLAAIDDAIAANDRMME